MMICSTKKSVLVEEPIRVNSSAIKSILENGGSGSTCPLRYGPMRILQLAEAGNVQEFTQLISEKPAQLIVRNNRGRTAAHQAALHNQVGILEAIEECKGDIGVLDDEGNSPLYIAIRSEAVDCIHYLLQNRAYPGLLNKKSQAALHLAAECGKIKSLRALAQYFYLLDVNQPGDRGRTPLHLACINDHFECVKILVEELHASPRRQCSHFFLPVHEAAKYGSWKSLEVLLCSSAKLGCPVEEMMSFSDNEGNLAIHWAVQSGNIETVQLCMKYGSKISAVQNGLSTAVHLACSQGSIELVKLMFRLQPEEKRDSLNFCDLESMTPLHYAALFDHTDLVEYLVNQGSRLNALDKNNCTPLHLAASKNACKTVKSLIALGADTKFQDKSGSTALHTIVKHNGDLNEIVDEETTMSLLPIVDIQDKHGHTALHIATKNGHVPTVRILLKMGSNVTVKNVEGENVFQIACRFGRTKLIQMIVDHAQFAAVLNRTNHRGWTPFHVAAKEGNITVIQVLMKKGAFLRKDYDGRTPLHLAAENGHKEVVSLILNTHSHLIDVTDNNGNSPLHSATINNEPRVADLLLRLKCQLIYNNDGCSAIDLAVMHKFSEVAFVMVTHKTRGDEVLGLVEGKYPCIMEALISKMPAVAKAVLDTGIKKCTTEKPDSPAYHVEYDFKWLALPGDIDKLKSSAYLPILNDMVTHNRVGLLSHELSLKYMEMKWKAYGKYFQFTNLIFYMLYLLVVTWVATNEMERDFKFYVRFKWFNESEDVCRAKNESCEFPTTVGRGEREVEAFRSYRNTTQNYERRDFLNAKIWLIALVAICNLLLELVSICRHGIKYCKTIDTWVWITMNINCVIATSFQIQARQVKANAEVNYALVNPSLANAVFMGWFYLFIMMQRFGAVGLYVSMFLEIVKTLLRVMVVFSALIIAFALAFFVLLSNGNHVAFSSFPMSMMTTLMWLMGDWEFVSTLLYPYQCEEMERANITNIRLYSTLEECKYPRRVPHPYVTFATVCIFLVFMPIVMMNLMIGLAVGDIESVRKNAQLKRLSMQVQSHISIEKSLPPFMLRKLDKTCVVEYPNVKKSSFVMECFAKFFPREQEKDDGDEVDIESDDLMEAILDNNVTLSQITSDIEHLKAMVKLMCAKLNINSEMTAEDELIAAESPPMSSLRKGWQRHLSRRVRKKPSPQRSHSSAM